MLYALILQFTVQVGFASIAIKCFSTEGKLGRTRRKKEKRKKESKQQTKSYHAMKKILLFWTFSSVTKSKS